MTGFEMLAPYAVAIAVLLLVVKLFALPFKLVWNGIIGGIMLWFINLAGAVFSFHINITVVTALIAGVFGVPGVIAIALWKMLS